MSETDLVKLYSGRILQLASSLAPYQPLEYAQSSVRKRSPLCGSTVTVELCLNANGKISEFSQNVKACALGQASAAILAKHVIGRDVHEIRRAQSQLKDMLTADGAIPDEPFEEFEVLSPARDFKNRHASILLALDATQSAMTEILSTDAS